ncbi:MAG: DUF2207 domain-containing protein, partial [Phaeodactylibacter sp.]|nr:DUF2207 domain-containing protein [Phaeodactylibacter sp.]
MLKYILIFPLLFISQAAALAEYFVIDRFDVRIRVDESGFFEVTETIDVTFSEPRHGIYRVIPYRFRLEGKKYDISLDDISVKGWEYKRERESGNLRLRIGDPNKYVEGRQQYVIMYKVKRAWLFEESHTEFYWNLTGNEWEVPIEKVDFRIQFPGNLNLTPDDYQVFTGYSGQQGSAAEVQWIDGVLSGSATRPFAPGEGLTVAVRLPASLIERPSKLESFMHDYGLLGIPAALLALLGWIFVRFGRDEPFVKMVQYYPPEGLPPAEAGAFIDDKTDNRDIISLLPYWGGQGYLTIREVREEKMFGLFSSKDFEFNKVESLPSGRPGYEYTVFNRLFSEGDTIRISDLKDKFHTTMSSARSQIQRTVRDRQLHTPQSRMAWSVLPVAAAICAGLGAFFISKEQYPGGGAMLLAAGIAFLLRRPMLKKNKEGMELYRQLYGFRLFVDKADRGRIERLLAEDPAYFEKTLPFAIAFGMAKKWAANFEELFTEPPRWYASSYHHGSRSNSFQSFASSFDSGMRQVQSTFTSSPGSSSGGGSSGGGFGGG